MPDWLERIVLLNAGVEYVPLLVCVGAAVVVWFVQWRRGGRRPGARAVVRVGWGPGIAIIALVGAGVAALGVSSGVAKQAWWLLGDDPWLAAWWVVGVGVVVAGWGVAVHAWRGEGRMGRRCRCGYDMSGVVGMRCPECGRVARSERRLRPRNVRRWALWAGGLIVVCGLLVPMGVAVARRGLAAALPDRVLLWWMAEGTPPPWVTGEAIGRAGLDPSWWRAEARARTAALAQRLMVCEPSTRGDYVAMITEGGDPSGIAIAMENLGSADGERRRSAAALLSRSPCPAIPLETVESLLEDPDPATRANARAMLGWMSGQVLQRLCGSDERPAESDPVKVRRLVQVLCETPPNSYCTQPDGLDSACASFDPETAARASVMRARWYAMTADGGSEVLGAGLLGLRTLRCLKLPRVPDGVGINGWLGYQQPPAAVLGAVDHADPRVRAEVLRELSPLVAVYAPYVRPGQKTAFTPIVDALRARVGVETDAEVRALLVPVVRSLDGGGAGLPK